MESNKLRNKLILIGTFLLLAAAFCISMSQCSRYKKLYEYSERFYTDSLNTYANKYNEIYTANHMYIANLEQIKNENTALYDEIKSLRDNPIIVTKIKTVYEIDTLTIESFVGFDTVSGNFNSDFGYCDEWSDLHGNFTGNVFTNNGTFTLDKLKFNTNITADVIEKKGNLYFIAKADNPYMTITNTEGYMLSPENSKVLRKALNRPWGVMVGLGCTATVYDNNVKILPGINLTLGYKILSF